MGDKSEMSTVVEPNDPPPPKKSRRANIGENISEGSSSNETMNPQLWKNLPEDVIEAVIARLPVATLFCFRTVCRKWNSFITSAAFAQHYAEAAFAQHYAEARPLDPWFYTIACETINFGAMYNPCSKKWNHPSVPFLFSKMINVPVASAGGLICFLDILNNNFYVCNPLTSSFKELPPRSVRVWSRGAVGMVLNGKTSNDGYKIMWLGRNGDHEIYDSVRNSWARPGSGSLPQSIALPLYLNFRSQIMAIGSTFYLMRSQPDGIVSYDIVTGVWKQFIIPLPVHLTDRSLAECGGKVMLVGLLTKNAATCVCVWELQRTTLLWKEVDRMPNVWCLEFYGKPVRMACLGNQGLIMLSLRRGKLNRLVIYDVLKREWQKVPDCMLPNGQRCEWNTRGTAFIPCITANA